MTDIEIKYMELRTTVSLSYFNSMKLISDHPDYKLGKNNYHLLSKRGKAESRLFSFMTRIDDLISDLEKTQVFIRRFPLKGYYESNNIDQLDYIKYHLEVFIHKIHTILEVKKLWLNDFYEIGLKEENCSWDNLKGHPKIQKSKSKKILDSYFKIFNKIINMRNINTHRAILKDTESDDIKTDLFIFENNKINSDEEIQYVKPSVILDYQIKDYRKKRLSIIEKSTKVAKKHSEQFITLILTEFLNKNK